MATVACKAIVIAEGSVWATLKRDPDENEKRFLALRDESTLTAAREAVRSLYADTPEWQPADNNETPISIGRSFDESSLDKMRALMRRDHQNIDPLCSGGNVQNKNRSSAISDNAEFYSLLGQKFGILAISMRTPASLAYSMTSWQAAGLLSLAQEKRAYLNEAMPAEEALAEFYAFNTTQPRYLPKDTPRRAGPDRLTIGSVFKHALQTMQSDFILVLEKDFHVPRDINIAVIQEELLAAFMLLKRGAFLVRLRSKRDSGCSGFKSCKAGANRPDFRAKMTRARRRNWFSFYCHEFERKGTVASCIGNHGGVEDSLLFRCFTSFDSNWYVQIHCF